MAPSPLLQVSDLRVSFATEDGTLRAVDGVSFDLRAGEVLAIVGESGSGKSVTAQTLIGLTRSPNAHIEGSVRFGDRDLITASDEELQAIRGEDMAMVFQDPMTSLNPVYRVGDQITEQILAHSKVSDNVAEEEAVRLLRAVGIPDAERRARDYPHEYSGGMRQRAMIAMALSLEPTILIADEPSTALDVTIQAQILRLLEFLNRDRGLALIIITHDLGVVAEVADRVAVMYAGKIVETGTVDDVFTKPAHPYTLGLMNSIPQVEAKGGRLNPIVGQPPNLAAIPSGCPFHPRCPRRRTGAEALPGRDCVADKPPLRLVVPGREAACHYSEEVLGV
jgi:oligopeptide transport system ATP-binding protein